MRKYRVWIGIKYCDTYFDFDEIGRAAAFMELAIAHNTPSDDGEARITMTVVNVEQDDAEQETAEV